MGSIICFTVKECTSCPASNNFIVDNRFVFYFRDASEGHFVSAGQTMRGAQRGEIRCHHIAFRRQRLARMKEPTFAADRCAMVCGSHDMVQGWAVQNMVYTPRSHGAYVSACGVGHAAGGPTLDHRDELARCTDCKPRYPRGVRRRALVANTSPINSVRNRGSDSLVYSDTRPPGSRYSSR